MRVTYAGIIYRTIQVPEMRYRVLNPKRYGGAIRDVYNSAQDALFRVGCSKCFKTFGQIIGVAATNGYLCTLGQAFACSF